MELETKQLKVVMFSTDPKLLESDSYVRQRILSYGIRLRELHIVLIYPDGKRGRIDLSSNTYLYQTKARTALVARLEAIPLGRKVIKENNLQSTDTIITAQDPFEIGLAAMILSKVAKLNLHVQIHTDLYSAHYAYGFKNILRLPIARLVLNYATAIRAVSEKIKRSLKSDWQTKTSVLPVFTDPSAARDFKISFDIKDKFPQFKRIILMASRITVEKDIPTALKAFKNLHMNDTGLVIIGSGPEKSYLKKQVKKLGLAWNVKFLPWTNQDELFSYFKTCDVFLSTSLFEGSGMSMIEAYGTGAPLVATDAGIASELTEHICAPGDVSCITQHMKEVLLNGNMGRKQYKAIHESKKEYFDAYVRDLLRAL